MNKKIEVPKAIVQALKAKGIVDLAGNEYKKETVKKKVEDMTVEERRQMFHEIGQAARAYIHQTVSRFIKEIRDNRDRTYLKDFNIVAKKNIIDTMPPYFNEKFIRTMGKIASYAEKEGYIVSFGIWKLTKEYAWSFVENRENED